MNFVSAGHVRSNVQRMDEILNRLVTLSKDVGTFNDGIHLREQIQTNVQSLMNLSKQSRSDIQQLRQNEDPECDSLQILFENVSANMKRDLPAVISSLKSAAPAPADHGNSMFTSNSNRNNDNLINAPLLDQQMLDNETDQLDLMEHEVNSILSNMREIQQLFQSTLQEIQKQRHIVASIDQMTSNSVDHMQKGTKELDKATQHQKGSRKALCWILIIVLILVGGAAAFCGVYFTKKKK
ncbi:hypothetical protein TRFO_30043 [Tritrichomonas foetus]|uniref:t-SNARE coiled-coil homology domain-containing protein n=1 Tax=Tritrichomonas foetus TaxID=1144522 RepID=A0A1J4JUA8_9EUKA|nr:hypothetical protein TRFO_30043 [Tritrichomonas foetus]|eukprot:OHT02735.1 hypothetical protein TRFO_30043 [Tritrichomonas foetus]